MSLQFLEFLVENDFLECADNVIEFIIFFIISSCFFAKFLN